MRAQAANDAALGALSHAPSPDPFKTPKKLGCGMVFKPHSCFLELMLAMLRYPMRSSRKRSVEPSRTTCLGVPGRPGTVSTRAWQLRRNRAPNLGQVHSAKRACTHACKPQTTRRWEPRRTHPPQTPSKPKKNWGAAWCLGWAGLGWAGLGWAALGWASLGWAGLGWAGLFRGVLGPFRQGRGNSAGIVLQT